MKISHLSNVKKSCQTTAKILGIISFIVTFLMVCSFVFAGVCFVFHSGIDQVLEKSPDIANNISTSITVFGIDMLFSGTEKFALRIGAAGIACGLALVFLKIAIVSLRKIFSTILNSESPFSEDVISTLKTSFVLITVFVALSTGIILALIIGIFLWCIYTIFQYGCDLQKEVDETI